VTLALYKLASDVDELGDHARAASSYDAVIQRCIGSTDPELRRRSAQASTRSARLSALGGVIGEGLSVLDSAIVELENASDPTEMDLLGRALLARSDLLVQMERPVEAIVVLDAIIARLESDADPDLRKLVARALMKNGIVLAQVGRLSETERAHELLVNEFGDEAIAAIDDDERTLASITDPLNRGFLAASLLMNVEILDDLGREKESRTACADLITRFEQDEDSSVAAVVAYAREFHAASRDSEAD
jgi:hypothetical protein